MTIKVEQEALLRVVDSHPPSLAGSDDVFIVVDWKPAFAECSVEKIRSATYDDDDSIFTLSTASLSDSDYEIERRVSFAEDLVTEEWTRPYTPKEEVSNLFYSTEETHRFRQEYRLERKLQNELAIDREVLQEEFVPPSCSSSRHNISRVVVLHNDKVETFSDNIDFDNDSFWSGSITWY